MVLLGIIATAALAVGAFKFVSPSYQLEASVLLVPPKLQTESGGNPYLALGGLEATADIVGRAVMAQSVVKSVVEDGGDEDFTVELDPSTSGPLLLVTTTADSVAQTQATMDLVLAEIPLALKRLQMADNVKKSFRITSTVVSQDQIPEVVRKAQLRLAIVAVGLGLAITLLFAALVDSWARRRRSRKQARAAAQPSMPEPDEPDPVNSNSEEASEGPSPSAWTDSRPGPRAGHDVSSTHVPG